MSRPEQVPLPIDELVGRPLPEIDNVSRVYWEALADGELKIQRCPACGAHQFYPRAVCVRCGANPEWVTIPATGVVHTFTIIRQNRTPPFDRAVPYVVAMIEVAVGVRLLGNITGCAPDAVRIGMRVQMHVTAQAGEGIAVPHWRP